MNTDLHPEEYPRLTPPTVIYDDKESLKKPAVIPLYVKIVSAAAAVALLFVLLWRPMMVPKQELMATMKPLDDLRIETNEPSMLAESQARFTTMKKVATSTPKLVEKPSLNNRIEMPLLAELHPQMAVALQTIDEVPVMPMPDDVFYGSDIALAGQSDGFDYDDELSLLRQGFLKMTEGKYQSFGEMIRLGWHSAKEEIAQVNESVSEQLFTLKQLNKNSDF